MLTYIFTIMIFYNIKRVCYNCHLLQFHIYIHTKTKLTTASVRTYDEEIEYWNNSFWKCAILKIQNKKNINVLKHIVHLYCTCFILGLLWQDSIKIFLYGCFFFCFHTSMVRWQSGPNRPWVLRYILPSSLH